MFVDEPPGPVASGAPPVKVPVREPAPDTPPLAPREPVPVGFAPETVPVPPAAVDETTFDAGGSETRSPFAEGKRALQATRSDPAGQQIVVPAASCVQ